MIIIICSVKIGIENFKWNIFTLCLTVYIFKYVLKHF